MQEKDYIIIGAGASGLLLAYELGKDPYFKDKKILIIDKDSKKSITALGVWEAGKSDLDQLVTKTWEQIYVANNKEQLTMNISPYKLPNDSCYRLLQPLHARNKTISKCEICTGHGYFHEHFTGQSNCHHFKR